MIDYQHLINELAWFAEQDKDFIALHESINTKAAEAIRQLIAERDELKAQHARDVHTIECWNKTITDLQAERDAAFAMSRCECESNEACKNLVALHDEVERLKSALRKAEKALVMNIVGTSGRTPATHEAITTIRTALGETE